jgi:predicted transporter
MPDASQGAAPIVIAPGTPKPTLRNPLMTMLLPAGVFVGAIVISIIATIAASALDSAIVAILGSAVAGLAMLAGSVLGFISVLKMMGELRAITKAESLAWWGLLIPFYSLYIALIVIPAEMTKAKQALRVQEPTRNIVLYWLLFLYVFAADLNDVGRAMPG